MEARVNSKDFMSNDHSSLAKSILGARDDIDASTDERKSNLSSTSVLPSSSKSDHSDSVSKNEGNNSQQNNQPIHRPKFFDFNRVVPGRLLSSAAKFPSSLQSIGEPPSSIANEHEMPLNPLPPARDNNNTLSDPFLDRLFEDNADSLSRNINDELSSAHKRIMNHAAGDANTIISNYEDQNGSKNDIHRRLLTLGDDDEVPVQLTRRLSESPSPTVALTASNLESLSTLPHELISFTRESADANIDDDESSDTFEMPAVNLNSNENIHENNSNIDLNRDEHKSAAISVAEGTSDDKTLARSLQKPSPLTSVLREERTDSKTFA